MQVILAIPNNQELQTHGATGGTLLRSVSGVPLVIRVVATGLRAGADRVLLVHEEPLPLKVQVALRSSKALRAAREIEFVQIPQFDPSSQQTWQSLPASLEDELLWLPWNFVTNKYSLTGLKRLDERPNAWDRPLLLSRHAVLFSDQSNHEPIASIDGLPVTSTSSVAAAERWLAAHSGKPLDGIYSRFNRWLCRPFVRALTHTPVTPNMVTLSGLLVAIVSAYCFSQGTYLASLAGALLFFLSGLLDEVDGMLARIRFSDSSFGTWFEGTVDNVSYLLLFIGITFGLYQQRGPQEVFIGEVTLLGAVLSILVISWQRKRSTRPDKPHEYIGKVYQLLEQDRGNLVSRTVRELQMFIRKGVVIHYVVLFTALGLLPLLLRLAALGSTLTWTLSLYFSYRFFRQQTPEMGAAESPEAAA
jgi:phosphatidylglycerophosphate synthase